MEHKDLIRDEFTRQAPAFADAPTIKDESHARMLVDAVAPRASDRVLDVACGPGHVTLAFAMVCREAVGIDLTEAPLKIAEKLRAERAIANARFQLLDADRLPFDVGEFDAVVCRFAMHHFPDPARVLGEMARVCRIGGKIGLEDIVASEHRAKADFHNQFERLRDTSHTRFLALSELAAQVARAGFDLKKFTSLELDNPVERWLETTQTPPDRAAKVREMIERDVAEDLSGADARRVGGALHFTHRAAILVGKRLA